MIIKKSLTVGALLILTLPVWADVRPAATPLAPTASKDGAETIERSYSLSKAQAEVLASLLRLEMPHDTKVWTDSRPNERIIINGPKQVHDAIAPLVSLLNEARAASAKERAEKKPSRCSKIT